MNNIAQSKLTGTKTAENLRQAFEKEAINFARESIYSSAAQNSKDISARRTFDEQADNDRRLAELWLSYLDEIDDTLENLYEMSLIKDALGGDIYPVMAQVAEDEGFDEIAEKLRLASAAKASHSTILKSEQDKLVSPDKIYSESPDTPWVCTACGYIVRGNTPPERCPLCAYPASYFV